MSRRRVTLRSNFGGLHLDARNFSLISLIYFFIRYMLSDQVSNRSSKLSNISVTLMDHLLDGPRQLIIKVKRNGETDDRAVSLTLPETATGSDLVARAGAKLGLPLASAVFFADGAPVTNVGHVNDGELLILSQGEAFLPPRPRSQEDFQGYRLLGKVGNGGFGTVYKAEDRSTGALRAVKVLSKSSMRCGVSEMQRVFNEMNALRNLKHPNIINFFEIVETRDSYGLVMELANGGDLLRFVETRGATGLDETEALGLFSQIVKAVNYCHSLNVTHGDIKLNNVVLCEDTASSRGGNSVRCKLLDFGLAQFVAADHKTRTDAGTQAYIAPEVHLHLEDVDPYKVDVWALGIVLYYLTQSSLPFSRADEKACVSIVNKTLLFRSETSVALRALVLRLLTVDSQDRPTLHEIIMDPCLRSGRAVLSSHQSVGVI